MTKYKFLTIPKPEELKIEYVETGEQGDTVLFLPGACNNVRTYKKLYPLVKDKFNLVSLSYPGLGNSARLRELSLIAYLETINAFIETKNITNFYLAGFSFGGELAIKYLQKYGNKGIKGVMLFSPLIKPYSRSLVKNGLQSLRQEIYRNSFIQSSLMPSVFEPNGKAGSIQELIKHAKLVLASEFDEQEYKSEIPTMVVLGLKDPIIDAHHTLDFFRNRTHVDLFCYSDCGHNAFAEINDDIIEHIANFIEKWDKLQLK